MTEDNMAQKALLTALISAQSKVGRKVAKEGSGDGIPFKYAGHEHVIDHVAAAMIEFGLVLTVGHVGGPRTLDVRKGDNVRTLWSFDYVAVLHHVDGGSIEMGVSATTIPGDKAAYIASTAADRTARLRFMAIAGTNEDPEQGEHFEDTPSYSAPRSQPSSAPSDGRHDRDLIYPFGKSKGCPIKDVDTSGIEWWAKKEQKNLADPSESKWHGKARKTLATLEAELAYRQSPPDFPDTDEYEADPF